MERGPVEVIAFSQDNKRELAKGTLLLIDNIVDQSSATMRLKAMFPNERDELWPGDFVNARLYLKLLPDALTIPSAAIQTGPDGLLAWVVDKDDVVQVRPIMTGPTTEGHTLVTLGLPKATMSLSAAITSFGRIRRSRRPWPIRPSTSRWRAEYLTRALARVHGGELPGFAVAHGLEQMQVAEPLAVVGRADIEREIADDDALDQARRHGATRPNTSSLFVRRLQPRSLRAERRAVTRRLAESPLNMGAASEVAVPLGILPYFHPAFMKGWLSAIIVSSGETEIAAMISAVVRFLAAAVLIATWCSVGNAQQCASELTRPAPSITEQKLDAAAVAFGEIVAIHQTYRQRLAQAVNLSDQDRVAGEARDAVTTVADEGLSLAEYNSIIQIAENDPDLRRKVFQRIRPREDQQ
jgi:hypothetical protein